MSLNDKELNKEEPLIHILTFFSRHPQQQLFVNSELRFLDVRLVGCSNGGVLLSNI